MGRAGKPGAAKPEEQEESASPEDPRGAAAPAPGGEARQDKARSWKRTSQRQGLDPTGVGKWGWLAVRVVCT
ncbi:hypothetical protein V499_07535 [Pseudogymnoascus sp. VKM F-103]|nr:hypothetical protein V499_07535 [Pseudogymnoascus sp. VKM F-103]